MSLVLLLRSAALYLLFATAAYAHILVPFSRERNIASRSADGTPASVPIVASGHVFVVNVTVGTPPQSLSLLLSPSSPHTWVPKAEVMSCLTGFDSLSGFHSSDASGSACKWGSFSQSKSSTARTAEQIYLDFVVASTDTINVSGVNITDTFRLGDIEVEDLSMGLVDSVSNQQWVGMIGLGNDATTNFPRPSSRQRPNLIDRLVASGKIVSQAYSIWLNNPEGASGSLLLGAIDKSRYEGDLIRLSSIEPYDVFPSAFAVNVSSVNVDEAKQAYKYEGPNLAVSISPAETFSYLPDALADGVTAAAGATWDTALQRVTIPCDAGSKNPKTNFRFQLEGPAGPVLNAHLADLVVPREITNWETAFNSLANIPKGTCLFGIQKYPDLRDGRNLQYNIGSSLLRRTYMVFDAANKDVALAPVKAGAAGQTPVIVPFEKQGARIPFSRPYCTAGDACPDESTTAGASTIDPSEKPKSQKWKKIVIGVCVPVGALAILIPIAYVLFMKRRKRQAEAREQWAAKNRTQGGSGDSIDEEDSFREDEFGVKVTVSVSSKVSMAKPPSPPRSPGLTGTFPIIPEERKSQFWGDAVLGAGGGGAGRSTKSGSETSLNIPLGSGGGAGGRKEAWLK